MALDEIVLAAAAVTVAAFGVMLYRVFDAWWHRKKLENEYVWSQR